MTDTDSSDRWSCPSPDDCSFTTDDIEELRDHVNSEHAGEYQRRDWPDTEAGRESREVVQVDDEDDEQQGGEPDA
ncbi:hypothetical protein [Natrinema sp. DC36]|uniref:hypothetical protein n=1 Tax=Natrinema sp. DC36 TaxID=2878680 RepID=UPI001CF032EF|nr:hypothetical protein [Natrinema sp. DC36]